MQSIAHNFDINVTNDIYDIYFSYYIYYFYDTYHTNEISHFDLILVFVLIYSPKLEYLNKNRII